MFLISNNNKILLISDFLNYKLFPLTCFISFKMDKRNLEHSNNSILLVMYPTKIIGLVNANKESNVFTFFFYFFIYK